VRTQTGRIKRIKKLRSDQTEDLKERGFYRKLRLVREGKGRKSFRGLGRHISHQDWEDGDGGT